jgi:glycosyltransferase 2 family protein
MRQKRKIYLAIISLVVSIILIVLLLSLSDTGYFKTQLININYHEYFYAFLVYICINLVIAFRLSYFFTLKKSSDYKSSIDVGVAHAMALCVLPLRLGDLVYPFLVKKYLNKTLASSIHNLIVLRVYDFISAAILFFVLLVFFIFVLEITYYNYVFIFFSLAAAYFLLKYFNKILLLVMRITEHLKLSRLESRLRDLLVEFENSANSLSVIDHTLIFLLSVIRWALSGIMLMFICNALQLNISFATTLFLTTGMNMAFIIPLQTIGGIGLLESVLALLLSILGQPADMATANAISIRILWFALPFLLGIIWFTSRKFCSK